MCLVGPDFALRKQNFFQVALPYEYFSVVSKYRVVPGILAVWGLKKEQNRL